MNELAVAAKVERMEIDCPEEILNPRAVIGGNRPPLTPYEAVKEKIDNLYLEATNWLDGEPVNTAELAAGVEQLETMLKSAIKEAGEAKETEKRPILEAGKEIDGRYNLLVGETKQITGTAIRALAACKQALTPWKIEQQRLKDEAARKAREEADRKAAEALAAHQAAQAANLAETEAADRLLREAEDAQKAAKRAEKATTTKTGLRTWYSAEIEDAQALSWHVQERDESAFLAFLGEWAEKTVRALGLNAGGMRIPGVKIVKHEEAR